MWWPVKQAMSGGGVLGDPANQGSTSSDPRFLLLSRSAVTVASAALFPNWPIWWKLCQTAPATCTTFRCPPCPPPLKVCASGAWPSCWGPRRGFRGEKTLRTPLGTELTDGLERRGKSGKSVRSGFKRLSHQDSVLLCDLHGRQTSAGRPVCA